MLTLEVMGCCGVEMLKLGGVLGARVLGSVGWSREGMGYGMVARRDGIGNGVDGEEIEASRLSLQSGFSRMR